MERLNRNISSRNSALEQRPKVLKAIRVNLPIDILNGVIHNLMCVFSSESLVGLEGIGIESRASFYVLTYFRLQSMFFAVRNYRGANLSATFKDSEHSRFIFRSCSRDASATLGNVHVSGFAPDKCLIYFDVT